MNAEAWCRVVHHRALVLAGLAAVDYAALLLAISSQPSTVSYPSPTRAGWGPES